MAAPVLSIMGEESILNGSVGKGLSKSSSVVPAEVAGDCLSGGISACTWVGLSIFSFSSLPWEIICSRALSVSLSCSCSSSAISW
jgi:hypothetical protein